MDHGQLPDGLRLARTTDEFDADSVPAGLLRAHRIAGGVWGVLRVSAGSLAFVHEDGTEDAAAPDDLAGGAVVSESGAAVLQAGDSMVIEPGVLHHVEPDAEARFHIEFHR